MKFEEAEKLLAGDIVYDPFGLPVVVSSCYRAFDSIDGLYVCTISTNLRLTTYHYKELLKYEDEFICDEYKSYLEWIRKEDIPFSLESKEAYMQGYAAGYSNKKYRQSEEQLQK